jgi:hypothetical protein
MKIRIYLEDKQVYDLISMKSAKMRPVIAEIARQYMTQSAAKIMLRWERATSKSDVDEGKES